MRFLGGKCGKENGRDGKARGMRRLAFGRGDIERQRRRVGRRTVEWRSGFLRCAAHGEAVSRFGRNDGLGGAKGVDAR